MLYNKSVGRFPSSAMSLESLCSLGFEPACWAPQDTPEDNSDKINKLSAIMRDVIDNELTECQRLIVLGRFDGISNSDMAIKMGISPGVASTHYKKGMRRLKQIAQYIAPLLR